jgi:hypothetical protein
MLGNVGDPEAIRIISVELALDEVVGRGHVGDPAKAWASCEPGDSGPCHQHLDGAVTDRDAESHGELGVDTPGPVGLA